MKTGSGAYSQIAIVGANVTSYGNTKLKASTTYYYRVRAYNAVNNSDYSNEADNTTLPPPPPVPKLKLPANKSTVFSLTPRLVWNVSKGASDYGLQVATDAGFTSLVIDETGIANIFYDITSGLDWNITYYWRVNARKNDGSTSKWSATRYFTTPP
jgi:hypothetical protein